MLVAIILIKHADSFFIEINKFFVCVIFSLFETLFGEWKNEWPDAKKRKCYSENCFFFSLFNLYTRRYNTAWKPFEFYE